MTTPEKIRVLLVEDDKAAANMLAKGLRENGYAVELARNGVEALNKARVSDYDLMLLDLLLPLKSGMEVCAELRRSGHDAPILMLTARDSLEDRISGLDLGADDYVTKPFEYSELLARIRALLRRGPTRHQGVLKTADLELDLRTKTAKRGGKPFETTQKEFAILEILCSNAGQPVSRKDITEHAWDENYDWLSNLLEVYIQRLRKKLDQCGGPKLIHTVRGTGYLLGPDPHD